MFNSKRLRPTRIVRCRFFGHSNYAQGDPGAYKQKESSQRLDSQLAERQDQTGMASLSQEEQKEAQRIFLSLWNDLSFEELIKEGETKMYATSETLRRLERIATDIVRAHEEDDEEK